MSSKRPPGTVLTWDPVTLDENFAGYDVGVRPARIPVADFVPAFAIRVPPGRDPVDIQDHHTRVIDVMAGWASPHGGRWADGHDWAYRAYDRRTGKPGPWDIFERGLVVDAPGIGSWVTTNHAWWLGCPLEVIPAGLDVAEDDITFTYPTVGPAGELSVATRVRGELPGRTASGEGFFFELTGHDQLRALRATAHAGLPVALLRKLGDRYLGTLKVSSYRDQPGRRVTGSIVLIENALTVTPAECNMACGIVLDGSTQRLAVADDPALRPGTGAWSFFVAGVFAGSGGSDTAYSKGDLAGSTAHGVRSTAVANELEAVFGAETLSEVSAEWFDGHDHVAFVTFDGVSTLTLYRDGEQVAQDTAVSPGNVSSSAAIAVGANDAGAGGHMASIPNAFGCSAECLTAAQVEAASGYLLGWPGRRMPAGFEMFHDRRDQRAGATTSTRLTDLSGNAHDATLIGSPKVRGYPAPLHRLESY